ncbi:flagellar basal-body MS-ring/collar protein FliF [Nocardioides pocheonensis]|nr:flagellar basal-body MS-ring/collar protein FliF [Nocardioides pocheonensis]
MRTMKDGLSRTLSRYQRTFAGFTPGQKAVAVVGTVALLLAGFMIFRWASTPSYAPLYSNLSSSDASAVIDKLDSQGVPYKLTNGGNTVMVPKDKVYSTRISLSGQGLPSSSDSGYSILDKQSLSTSQFQEQTNFKRAMEAELSRTVEALNGVDTAVVHLALPEKQVFADKQDPPTASVLVSTKPGSELSAEQVQAIVNLIASSVDGLQPDKVTVADAAGHVLSATDGTAGIASSRDQQVQDYQNQMSTRVQQMLDRVVGPGNSSVAVTANLDFDKSVTEKKSYTYNKNNPPLSESKNIEKFTGPGAGSGLTGVVGPDGQMDSTSVAGSANSQYEKSSDTVDNAVDTTVEHRETAPGGVRNLHVGVVLDAAAARSIDPNQIQTLIASAVGIDPTRGDTVQVDSLPFDRSAEKAAKAELAAAKQADASAKQATLIRNSGLAVLILLIVLLAWFKGRKRAKERADAASYVVEQLRLEALERAATQTPVEPSAAMLALESMEHSQSDEIREELASLVERQPEDVAALLRGWLVEPR